MDLGMQPWARSSGAERVAHPLNSVQFARLGCYIAKAMKGAAASGNHPRAQSRCLINQCCRIGSARISADIYMRLKANKAWNEARPEKA